jgi:formylglycine-generating enzyme required for sulfatase activity
MIFRAGSFIVFPIVIVLLCAPLSTDTDHHPADLPHPGMKKIESAGKSFQQGWNDTLASADEKPGMVSSFTYDYWLDITEVTQKQYRDITGRVPVMDSTQYGEGDRYPVCFVTWYDAVLFCNARSRADGLDTVYRYTGRYVLFDGSVHELSGLVGDFSKDGYRLPTEAEWEFAASGGESEPLSGALSDINYAQSVAWFGGNSSGMSRPVGTKMPNAAGLYDLAGNVFEWTNDWKGVYRNKTVVNSLGASEPNGTYEKVVKGGAYNSGLASLRPSYRSAPFTSAIFSGNGYTGFRCARGAIPGGHYFDSAGGSNPDGISLDSLGMYYDSSLGTIQKGFATKMHLFWKLHNEIEVAFLGIVSVYSGVDCGAISHYKALNMGFTGCGIYGTSTIMSNYLFVNAPRLKLIGINIPYYFFAFPKGEPAPDFFDSTICRSSGYRYDKSHNFWKDGTPAGFDEAMAYAPYPSLEVDGWDSLGLLNWYWACSGWGSSSPDTSYAQYWTINDPEYIKNFVAFDSLIKKCSARSIHLLAINFPESPYYKNTGHYLKSGPSWETGRAVLAQLEALQSIYPYFHVYDAYQDGNHDYTDEDAFTDNQLCPHGAEKLGTRLDSVIQKILRR